MAPKVPNTKTLQQTQQHFIKHDIFFRFKIYLCGSSGYPNVVVIFFSVLSNIVFLCKVIMFSKMLCLWKVAVFSVILCVAF